MNLDREIELIRATANTIIGTYERAIAEVRQREVEMIEAARKRHAAPNK